MNNKVELNLSTPALELLLNVLLDEIGEDESHILLPLLDQVGDLVEERYAQ